MGIGDSIERAAKNAVEDLAGTADRTDDGHAPDPGDPNEDIRVHSSISEGSNATDTVDPTENPSGTPPEQPQTKPDEAPPLDDPRSDPAPYEQPSPHEDTAPGGNPESGGGPAQHGVPGREVPGSGGLPDANPDELRADPSEADGDPTTSMGRG